MALDIDKLPRVRINFLPTPLVQLKRLDALLRGPTILMKRDDMTGVALGGNKTRKLEFLLGEALHQGCDTVITGGAVQSNHCRQTAGAAAMVGLECHLALGGERPDAAEGNLLLDLLFGAKVHWCGEQKKGERIPEIAERLRSAGRRPYVIPFGGSNTTGAMGFVAAVRELREQLQAQNRKIDCLVIPSASGGTHAGITVGADVFGLSTRIVGIAIDRAGPGAPAYEAELAALANLVAEKLGTRAAYSSDSFEMRYDYFGAGYGAVGDLEREAIRLGASLEGVLLDPVYSGRALGGMIDMIRNKELRSGQTVLFWHTGGTPALFELAGEVLGEKEASR
jgi:D-cysteine desulfhydrase